MIKFLDLKKLNSSFEPELSLEVEETIKSGKYLFGEKVSQFEMLFADFVGVKECIGVANGMDALTLIFMALKQLYNWEDGDEVIVPAYTFIASAQAVNRAKLKPIFCDVNAADGLINLDAAVDKITSKTRALLPVHLFGKFCDTSSIRKLLNDKGIFIVEDAAQAHGATNGIVKVGELSMASAFSFYPGKNLGALGDGGAVVTNNTELATLIRSISNYGSSKKYYHRFLGINSRLDEIQAAILCVKLKSLATQNERRAQIAHQYISELSQIDVQVLDFKPEEQLVWHIFPIFTPYRDQLFHFLQQNDIETLIHYPIPLHKQEAYKLYNNQSFPIAERMAASELSLPISPVMDMEEVSKVSKVIRNFFINR